MSCTDVMPTCSRFSLLNTEMATGTVWTSSERFSAVTTTVSIAKAGTVNAVVSKSALKIVLGRIAGVRCAGIWLPSVRTALLDAVAARHGDIPLARIEQTGRRSVCDIHLLSREGNQQADCAISGEEPVRTMPKRESMYLIHCWMNYYRRNDAGARR